jgi:hypothetical protein
VAVVVFAAVVVLVQVVVVVQVLMMMLLLAAAVLLLLRMPMGRRWMGPSPRADVAVAVATWLMEQQLTLGQKQW